MSLTNINNFSKHVIRENFVMKIPVWIGGCEISHAVLLKLLWRIFSYPKSLCFIQYVYL